MDKEGNQKSPHTGNLTDPIARDVTLKGKIKGNKRRAVTPALAIRFVLLMTLMPAHYAEVMAALIGDLATVPWHRPCALPTAAVASARRKAIGPARPGGGRGQSLARG